MDLFDFTITISLPVATASTCILLLHFTPLPYWGALLISLPIGAILGILLGIGLGCAIAFIAQRR